jgi:hypothetical protein
MTKPLRGRLYFAGFDNGQIVTKWDTRRDKIMSQMKKMARAMTPAMRKLHTLIVKKQMFLEQDGERTENPVNPSEVQG